MEESVRNLLYERPDLYEIIYPEPDEATPAMCLRMFDRFLERRPKSILDVGCGTARDLAVLSRSCPDCWGVDYLPQVVRYASSCRPHLKLSAGDMRFIRLGRTFEVILCMGSALTYAINEEDIERTLGTFAEHEAAGALLVLDLNNAASYFGSGFKESLAFSVNCDGFKARAEVRHEFDRRKQLLVRHRTWHIEGEGTVEDFCRYRMFFPAELQHRLADHGFTVVGMFDNKQLQETDLSGPRLYVAAIYRKPTAPAG